MTSTSDRFSTLPDQALEAAYRTEWGRLLSLLVARTRRLDLVEDALSEAFARAALRWPIDGVPTNAAGWLYTTAHRHVVGRLRAEATAGRKAPLLAVRPDWVPPVDVGDELADERLQLILLCCHPALPQTSQSALALRLVIGTPTEQIARLFLVPTATMAARLTRAKKKIVAAGIPLGAPVADEFSARLDEICQTIYLAFTAGYAPGAGPDLLRADLAAEAVRLATVLHRVAPEAPQPTALLALLILQHSRRDARVNNGELVTLASQHRRLWHHDEIHVGLELIDNLSPAKGYSEQLRLQALIAAAHARARVASDTDWVAIAKYYQALEELTGSAIVRMNRAVAVAEAENPQEGLALLASVSDELHDHHRFAATCGELAHRAGDTGLAIASFQAALELCDNNAERSHLRSRLAEVSATALRKRS